MPSFDEIREDFLRITTDVVWATVATVDTRGRPRTRIMHVECRASWAEDQNERVWQMFLDAEPPLGYDPADIPPWKEGPSAGVFAALRLDPWRVLVLSAEDAAAGPWYQRYWQEG